jgi:starch-binding outer membrane protein, SusD/RagB family
VTFLAKHNELRATRTGLAPVSLIDVTAMTQAQRVDLHFQERAFWLWLTGQRLSDMRRLVRQYNRPQETVFPTGTFGRSSSPGRACRTTQLDFRARVRTART